MAYHHFLYSISNYVTSADNLKLLSVFEYQNPRNKFIKLTKRGGGGCSMLPFGGALSWRVVNVRRVLILNVRARLCKDIFCAS